MVGLSYFSLLSLRLSQILQPGVEGRKKTAPGNARTCKMLKGRCNFLHDILFKLAAIAALIRHASAADADVMANLAKSITPVPAGWSGLTFCKWQGVFCDSAGRVNSINLASRSLTGIIPSDINQLSNLKSLSLQKNLLSGPAPALSNLGVLQEVNLDFNNFDSFPPGFLSGLTSLQTFSINNNSNLPPWTIPGSLKDSTVLVSFFASKSNVVGEIPDIFGSLPNLQSLRLSYNNMSGFMPASFAKSGIQNLWLNNQMGLGFSGGIDVLGTMTQLTEVWLHVNKFTGPIPDLSGCQDLYDIQLRENFLTGVIPDSLTKLPKLKEVSLQKNKFQGPTPSFAPGVQVNVGTTNSFCNPTPGPCDPQVTVLLEIAAALGYPMPLAESWAGNNPCQNWRFVTCGTDGSVTIINFSKQNWTGTISSSFSKLPNLKSILLNDNKLEGTIPPSLTSLKLLQILDVSNNNIYGKVPAFSSSVTVNVSGNVNIGKDFPGSSPGGEDDGSVSPWIIVVSILAAIFVMAVLGYLAYRKHSQTGGGKQKRGSPYQSDEDGKSFSYGTNETPIMYDGGNVVIPIEALREATDGFSKRNVIGKGGFGVVYKGQLQDGTRIAVKRMESCLISDKGKNEFNAEIEVLTRVRHRHLVALHGFCNNGDEKLLVYEYMPQGCLGQHLFGWQRMRIPPLTWNQRVTIALDVARGVEYLHSLAQQSFIHRDLKPSNVLLGDDMRAKVSDFGLVKSAPDGKYSFETKLAGTFGYLAPEYAATGKVTTKVDVFAFGVMLMEIITGRKALDDSLPEDQSHLVAWFRRLLPNKSSIKAALDPIIRHDDDEEENFKDIWKVAELAGHCTARESYQRPDMSHAVNVLSPLVEQWQPVLDKEENVGVHFQLSLPQVLQKWKANEATSSISRLDSDFYNNSNTNDYSTSTNSTGAMLNTSEFSSSSHR